MVIWQLRAKPSDSKGSTVVVGDPFGNHGDIIDHKALVCFTYNCLTPRDGGIVVGQKSIVVCGLQRL